MQGTIWGQSAAFNVFTLTGSRTSVNLNLRKEVKMGKNTLKKKMDEKRLAPPKSGLHVGTPRNNSRGEVGALLRGNSCRC